MVTDNEEGISPNQVFDGAAPSEISVASVLALRPNDEPEDAYEVFQDEVRNPSLYYYI